MIRVEKSVLINRPVEEVFTYVTNPEHGGEWQTDLQELRQTSAGPLGAGTIWKEVRHFLGRRWESSQEITEFEPNKKLRFKTKSGPIPTEGGYLFEPVAEGETKVTLVGEGDVSGFFKLAEPVVGRMAKRQVEAAAANLKDILEAQTTGSE